VKIGGFLFKELERSILSRKNKALSQGHPAREKLWQNKEENHG
jgi:hypothetical protein